MTSVAQLPDGTHIGLAYVKCRAKGVQVAVEGLHLSANGSSAQVRGCSEVEEHHFAMRSAHAAIMREVLSSASHS